MLNTKVNCLYVEQYGVSTKIEAIKFPNGKQVRNSSELTKVTKNISWKGNPLSSEHYRKR
jgi:hypothetical protein